MDKAISESRRLPEQAILLYAPWIHKKDLRSFSLTCRLFYEVALPFIYERIEWTWFTTKDEGNSLCYLLRSLRENQELASLIKHVNISGPHHRFEETSQIELRKTIDEETISYLKKVVRSAELPTDEWFPVLRDVRNDTLVSLLLLQLPKLRTLRLDRRFHLESRMLGSMLSHVIFSQSKHPHQGEGVFSQLKEVHWMAWEGREGLPRAAAGYDGIQALFLLPSVRTLDILMEDRTREYKPFVNRLPICVSKAPCLTNLILRRSAPRIDILKDLVAGLPNLIKLFYEWTGFGLGEETFDVETYFDAVRPLKNNLKEMAVEIQSFEPHARSYSRTWQGIHSQIANIQEFVKLENVKMPLIALLVGSNGTPKLTALPKSIRHINFTKDAWPRFSGTYTFEQVLASFEDCFLNWKAEWPFLEKITLFINDEWSEIAFGYGEPEMEALRRLFREMEIVYEGQ